MTTLRLNYVLKNGTVDAYLVSLFISGFLTFPETQRPPCSRRCRRKRCGGRVTVAVLVDLKARTSQIEGECDYTPNSLRVLVMCRGLVAAMLDEDTVHRGQGNRNEHGQGSKNRCGCSGRDADELQGRAT
jgi:hypothetical protein